MILNNKHIEDYRQITNACDDWKNRKTIFGVSPIAPLHFGYDSLVLLQKEAINLGIKRNIIVISDLHAIMSHRISWDEIRSRSYYYEYYFKEVCQLENTDFLVGSYFQTRPDYIEELYSALREISLSKVKDTVPSAKKNEPTFAYVAVYALMQCIDIFHVNADIVLAEEGQRKIYDLTSNIIEIGIYRSGLKTKFKNVNNKIDFIYVKTSHDIKGNPLNISSAATRISIHETENSLLKKINQMYAPPPNQSIETGKVNALLETFKFSVFPWFESISLMTLDGKKEYSTFNDFEIDYNNGTIHPNNAKKELFIKMKLRIDNIKSKLEKGLTSWIDFNQLIKE